MFTLKKYHSPDFSEEKFKASPDAKLIPCPADGIAPFGYHAMSIYPEYFKVDGQWLLAKESRMDCVAVYKDGEIHVVEFRNLKKSDLVIMGRKENCEEGIFVYPNGFREEDGSSDIFAFRSGRSRETAFSKDYDDLAELLEHEKHHGKIVWVLGPAAAFDKSSRDSLSKLIANGYAHALLAGNALGTHDLEAAWLGTALGQDVYTQESMPLGHYNHLDLLNKVRSCGSVADFIKEEKIENGIIYSCEKYNVPYVLGGSIRDDGPLPCVFGNVYECQNAMRDQLRSATTVIGAATMLHTIASGNMTPSYRVLADGSVRQVYFYYVDVSEFVANKLMDRGSLSSKSILTNVQDFTSQLCKRLGI